MIKVKKRMVQATLALLNVALVTSCASVSVNEYPNITINKEKKVETIKFTHSQSSRNEKSAACVLENVENKEIPIEVGCRKDTIISRVNVIYG
ncbi:hypothetical protein [Oceanimonas marisflavi]|uniref:hypothetical protein n=1 Tax=Oceanimonas marisflavi TaxID=2059724 RepID=UPI00130037ED|nr:hypothetical protein [Oceanimonas marisflavi]